MTGHFGLAPKRDASTPNETPLLLAQVSDFAALTKNKSGLMLACSSRKT
jgi:hypothetical protein